MKKASKGKADQTTMLRFQSGELDRELRDLTQLYGAGRFYNEYGEAFDLRPYAFEDFLETQRRSP